MATVFISYRREDSGGYAGRLHEELEERLETRVFRDLDTLEPGQDFVAAIDERLRECEALVALLGPGWLMSRTFSGERRIDAPGDFVRMEIAAALARPDVLVVPVLVGGASMPSDAQLPDDIRALSRRQAVVLRDETWEDDVDRLANVMAKHIGGPSMPRARQSRSRRTAIRAGIVLTVAAVALAVIWSGRLGTGTVASPPATAAPPDTGAPIVHAIEIPRMSEIAHGDLIFTLLAGSLRPARNDRSTLWLRFRVSNEGSTDANLWDQSFRISAGGEVVPASGGLNEILDAHSIQQQVVRFDIPPGTPTARLQITVGGRTGELPLDLASTGGPPKHEEPDAGDALSRADLRRLVREPVVLVGAGDVRATLTRATMRRFVNETRVVVTVRLENRGAHPRFSGDMTLRLLPMGGGLTAPSRVTSAVVEPRSTLEVDAVFDLSPTSSSAVLHGSIGSATGEASFQLR